MNILCLNTAFKNTYVAVNNNKKTVFKCVDSSLKQSENVLGVIDSCLTESKLTLENLNAVACVIGPGSFTGIRIGASMAKGFCMALPNLKKIQINSLDLLAFSYVQNNQPNQDFWVVLNALSGNLFACKYSSTGKTLTDYMMVFGEQLEQISGMVVGLKEEELSLCNAYAEFSCEHLLQFALNKAKEGGYANDFVPLYLRKSQAEAELDKKMLKPQE